MKIYLRFDEAPRHILSHFRCSFFRENIKSPEWLLERSAIVLQIIIVVQPGPGREPGALPSRRRWSSRQPGPESRRDRPVYKGRGGSIVKVTPGEEGEAWVIQPAAGQRHVMQRGRKWHRADVESLCSRWSLPPCSWTERISSARNTKRAVTWNWWVSGTSWKRNFGINKQGEAIFWKKERFTRLFY